jgi:hypothetical protein
MIFRDSQGILREINKKDFITDKEYYSEILKVKEIKFSPKDRDSVQEMMSLIKQSNTNIHKKNYHHQRK